MSRSGRKGIFLMRQTRLSSAFPAPMRRSLRDTTLIESGLTRAEHIYDKYGVDQSLAPGEREYF